MFILKLLLLALSFSFDRPAVKQADALTYESPADYRTVVCASGRKVKGCRP